MKKRTVDFLEKVLGSFLIGPVEPEEPGFYWVKTDEGPELVSVFSVDDRLRVRSVAGKDRQFIYWLEDAPFTSWAGPICLPPEPGSPEWEDLGAGLALIEDTDWFPDEPFHRSVVERQREIAIEQRKGRQLDGSDPIETTEELR